MQITAAWDDYHVIYLNGKTLPDEEERKLLGALIAISTGVEDESKLNVPEEVGRRLLACYDDVGRGSTELPRVLKNSKLKPDEAIDGSDCPMTLN